MPDGLTFLSTLGNANFSNEIVFSKVDTMHPGDSHEFSYRAIVTGAGPITNVAELFTVDQRDTILYNNRAEFTNQCF